MDLSKILSNVEGKEDLIKQIEAEIGKEFVPRSEFNAKNSEVKERDKQIGELNQSLDELTKSKATRETEVAELAGKIKSYESASLKARIAHEAGIPYELAGRLSGEDEDSIRSDAEALSKLIAHQQPLAPLKDTEPAVAAGENAAYKELLQNIKGE